MVYMFKINHIIRQSKNNYYKNFFENNKINSKTIWNGVNDLLFKHKNKQVNINLYENGELITDAMSVANKFNNYFTTIGPKLSNKIQNLGQHFSTFMPPKSDKGFYLSPTTHAEVALEIKSLSDSTSSDILIKLIKSASRHISNILSHIFNHSFETGDYPKKTYIC